VNLPFRSKPKRKNAIFGGGFTIKRYLYVLFIVSLLFSGCSKTAKPQAKNSIFVIVPYKYQEAWVFDDPRVGLFREPFVAGIPEIIGKLVQDIPHAEKGFRLLFSASPFPGYAIKLDWRREENGGNWYFCEEYNAEGWLCPALFKYYAKAPPEIYVKAEKR